MDSPSSKVPCAWKRSNQCESLYVFGRGSTGHKVFRGFFFFFSEKFPVECDIVIGFSFFLSFLFSVFFFSN